MNSIPHLRGRSSARPSFALLSVLALLALACFPVLAQAQDATGVQYETAVPTVTGTTKPPKSSGGSTADSQNGNATATGSGSSSASGSGSSSGGPSSKGNPSTGSGGSNGQGSQGNGSTAANGVNQAKGNEQQADGLSTGKPASSKSDDSSPLIPILIAIAALAAISIGVVVIRQRRQRQDGDPGAQVSPKAS